MSRRAPTTLPPRPLNGGGPTIPGEPSRSAVGIDLPRPDAPDALTDAVRAMLHALGEDPDRAGLKDTPRRVASALREMTSGRDVELADTLDAVFPESHDGLVLVRDVPFTSLCEHHLLPFTGHVSIAYEPAGRVVGLSKLARLVDASARRLQLQERLTREIADAVESALAPRGVAVRAEAAHACMSARGVRATGTSTVTSVHRGSLDTPDARAELARSGAGARA